ncbi:hypothetical protein vseg_007810 [Gypsophila vaccaria]
METPDHQNPNSSGHGGVHVCHKCGWPYPNPHPSSKIRRAHKKVCGTIDKYKLDDDALEKARVEGCDGELHSDDEFEAASVKRTISRKSSSGVGSRSSRSNRSEEELFTDAVTEFNESPAVEASGGGMQRFYSMQNEFDRDNIERDNSEHAKENPIAGPDALSTINHFEGNQQQTVENVDDDKVESGMASQDHTSTKAFLVPAVVTSEIENTVDRKIEQASEPSSELDIVSERGKEVISSKVESELRTSHSETSPEVADVCNLKGVCDEAQGATGEHLASVSTGELIKTSLMQIDGAEDSNGRFDAHDSSEIEKIGSVTEAYSSGNFYSVHQVVDINSGNGNISKPELLEEREAKIGSNESVYDLLGSDVLPLEQHPEIEVEDLDHIKGKNSISEAANSAVEFVDHSKASSIEDGGSDIAFTKTSDCGRVFSEDFSIRSLENKLEENQKYVDEKKTSEEKDHISHVASSNADVNIFKNEGVDDLKSEHLEVEKDSGTEEKTPITSLENIFPEGATVDAGKITLHADSTRSVVEEDGEDINVMDHVGRKIVENEDDLATRKASIKPTIDEVTKQDLESLHVSDRTGNGENNKVEGAVLNKIDISDGAAPHIIADYGKSDRALDEEIGSSEKNVRMEEFPADNDTNSTLKTDGLNIASKVEVDEDAVTSNQSPAAVDLCSDEKVAEDTSHVAEGDRVIKQQVTNSAIDAIVDSGSLSDSLDGNWGSVSVMSTTSDAIPTADTIALNHPRSLESEESPSKVPNPVMESQHSQNQVSVEPEIGIQQVECTSEIHPSNEPNRGTKDKEIIDKVAKWDSGKQNTPLKTLLGEATAKSRAESPIHHYQTSSSTSVLKTDAIPGTNNGLSAKTENVILNSDHAEMETAHEETGKEWNSPARYPVNIKTEKRRSKKTYWAPFLCCSSVNAR